MRSLHSLQSAYGRFDWPDPRLWPTAVVQLYRHATEPRSLRDIFLFDLGDDCAAYMEDAVIMLALLPIPRAEFFTDRGYPSLVFDRSKLQQYTRGMQEGGYAVQIVENPASASETGTGNVVSITKARESMFRKRRKWA